MSAGTVPATVRPATNLDLPAIVAIERTSYSDPWAPTAFASLPDNPAVWFMVAAGPDGAIVGYAIAWRVLDEAELANLAVAGAARRAGIGSQLLDAILDRARRESVDRVYLEVREANAAARQLYASRGFAEVGRRKKYYKSPEEDALILRREMQ